VCLRRRALRRLTPAQQRGGTCSVWRLGFELPPTILIGSARALRLLGADRNRRESRSKGTEKGHSRRSTAALELASGAGHTRLRSVDGNGNDRNCQLRFLARDGFLRHVTGGRSPPGGVDGEASEGRARSVHGEEEGRGSDATAQGRRPRHRNRSGGRSSISCAHPGDQFLHFAESRCCCGRDLRVG
jgi:hypothetical protein